jgi:hypothetical protein
MKGPVYNPIYTYEFESRRNIRTNRRLVCSFPFRCIPVYFHLAAKFVFILVSVCPFSVPPRQTSLFLSKYLTVPHSTFSLWRM